MISQLSLVRYLNKELDIRSIPDSSLNGIQVNGGNTKVGKIGLAVDASLPAMKMARKKGCDLVIAHHGIFWKGVRDHFSIRGQIIGFCRKNRMSLYASHLPLDLHPVYGNNAELARILEMDSVARFGEYNGMKIGFKGIIQKTSLDGLSRRLERALGTSCVVIGYGPKEIHTAAVVSGGGSSALKDALRENIDVFITGEAPHHSEIDAMASGMNMILAGHYQTETLGVKSLGRHIRQKFNIPSVFLSIPTKI